MKFFSLLKDIRLPVLFNLLLIFLLILIFLKLRENSKKIDQIGILQTRTLIESRKKNEIRKASVNTEDRYYIGEENAPITIVQFIDYQCGYCKKFHKEIFLKLYKNYILTGKVKMYFIYLPLNKNELSKEAVKAAIYSENSNKFLEMHDFLLSNKLSRGLIIKKLESLSVNNSYMNTNLNNKKILSKIEKDIDIAKKNKIRGTPAFIINGNLHYGASSYENFIKKISTPVSELNSICN